MRNGEVQNGREILMDMLIEMLLRIKPEERAKLISEHLSEEMVEDFLRAVERMAVRKLKE